MIEGVIAAVVLASAGSAVRLEQVHEGECGLLLRLGKHRRTVGPGPCLVIRGVERLVRVPTKIMLLTDLVAANCQTRDNTSVDARYHLRLRVGYPDRVLRVEDWRAATLAQAEVVVRTAISAATLAELLSERPSLGSRMSGELDQVTCIWGASGEIEVADIQVVRRLSAA